MSDYDMSIHTNPDAEAWVKFFRECNPNCNVPDDLLLGVLTQIDNITSNTKLNENGIEAMKAEKEKSK